MVDVWLLSSIFFIFIIIVLHTMIDRVREWEPTIHQKTLLRPKIITSPASSEKVSPSNTISPSEGEKPDTSDATVAVADVEVPVVTSWWVRNLCLGYSANSSRGAPRSRPLYEKFILGARIFVLGLLIVFNLIYWTIVLT